MSTAVKRRKCVDCAAEGISTNRKLATKRDGSLQPGPRCYTHHKGKQRKASSKSAETRWINIYGITADEYWKIYELQGGRCFICQRATGAKKRLSVDHDHATGYVRGELCTMCNKYILGHARDSVEFFERCIEYLTNPPAFAVIGQRPVPGHFQEEEE